MEERVKTEIDVALGVSEVKHVTEAVEVYNHIIGRCENERLEVADTSFQTEEGDVVFSVSIESEGGYKTKKHREISQSCLRKVNDHIHSSVSFSYETETLEPEEREGDEE